MKMKQPNFFVAGAPRCGTTALYTYLWEHPNIFLPEVKEFHYFASDFPGVQKLLFKSVEDYLNMFAGAGDRHLAVGEVSPLYIYSKVALKNIKAFNPSAKIILTLRNPVDYVQSMHQLNLSLLRDDEVDLAKAWELQELRQQGKMIPKSCREPQLLFYGELGLFGKHVENVFNLFPKDQVLIVLLDDLSAKPKAVYESILSFLDVPSDGRREFQPVNANFEQKSIFFAKLIHPPQPVYNFFMKGISMFGAGFMKNVNLIYGKIEALNVRRTPRSSITPELRAQLQSYFRSDIQKLGELMDRDLSVWIANN